MKTIKTLMILGLVTLSTTVRTAEITDQYHKKLTDVSGVRVLTIENVNGDCVIRPTDDGQIMIDAEILVKGSSEDACREFYEKADIRTERDGDTVLLTVDYPRNKLLCGFGKSASMTVDFTISVPAGTDLDLDLVNGDVRLNKLGECRIDLVNGECEANGCRSVLVDMVNGSVAATEISNVIICDMINGNVKLETRSSDLEKVRVESINGSIELTLIASVLGRLHLSSSTGQTYLKERDASGNWKTKLKGKHVTLMEDGKARISLETVNGKIAVYCER